MIFADLRTKLKACCVGNMQMQARSDSSLKARCMAEHDWPLGWHPLTFTCTGCTRGQSSTPA